MKILINWFPVTIFDWEEILLGLGESFYRKECLPDYDYEHYSVDRPVAILFHGAFLAALYDGIDLTVRQECPVMIAGRKLVRADNGRVVPSKHQYLTTPVEKLFFTGNGPMVQTSSGSEYLLTGENLAFSVYSYLKDQPERPDLIEKFFEVV